MSDVPTPNSPRHEEVPIWAPRSIERAIVPLNQALPPAPPGCRYVPVKWLGVVIADDDLRKRVDRRFHKPMILLALLVLPLLVLDYVYIREVSESGATGGWLWWLVISGLTIIWIAFTLEFVIKIAIAESRLEYLRRNWLDLIIIVIPILRPLRMASVARTTRVFTLRGVGFKFARYVFTLFIGLEATNRMFERLGIKPRVARVDPEQMTRHQLTDEVKRLRRLADEWSQWYARQQQYLSDHSRASLPEDHPREASEPDSSAEIATTPRQTSPS